MENTKDIIPIVLAANNDYVPFMATTIASIISTASSENHYRIFVFHTKIKKKNQEIIEAMKTSNVDIQFINVKDHLRSSKLYSTAFFSVEMYYRILIPEILSDYDKAIYLDSDLIVLKDVAELYNTDLGEEVIGAVNDACISSEDNQNEHILLLKTYVSEKLKLETKSYFNSGVLLLNNKKFLEYNLKPQCFAFLKKYRYLLHPDQDVLNLFCYGKRMTIPREWNFQTGNSDYTEEYIKNEKINPNIVHFTSVKKPWNSNDVIFRGKYLEIAKTTPYYNIILSKIKRASKANTSAHCLFGKICKDIKIFGFKSTCGIAKRKLLYPARRLLKKIDKNSQPIIAEEDVEKAKECKF